MAKPTRRFLSFAIAVLIAVQGMAQTQQGLVKTIGRPNKPGIVLGNVVLRFQGVVNSVITSSDGKFHLYAPNKKDGDAIKLLNIQKNGYELRDKGLIGRPMVFSTRVPIEILMVDINQLAADKERIEKKAYQVAENNYQKKLRKIENQLKKEEISAEEYRKELQDLQNKYEKYMSLISDMADRYARTDYDHLDSIDYKINLCIENGELDRADSLIHTVFDPETVLERNRSAKNEIQQRIEFAQSVIDKANADKEAIKRDEEYAKRVVELCNNLSKEYLIQGNFLSAIDCLKKSLEIQNILYGPDNEKTKATILQIESIRESMPDI